MCASTTLSESKQRLLKRLGYEFNQPELLQQALSHRSVGNNNNERLEFLGDAILNFLMAEALYNKFPATSEGQLSQMRASLVKGTTLAEIARDFDLGPELNLGPGELKSGGHRRESILADAVEAIIGAMYLDGGMDTCRHYVSRWFASRLAAIVPESSNRDAKSLLQELLQAHQQPLPVYELQEITGSDHQQSFHVDCVLTGLKKQFSGSGNSRKKAEQAAASAALTELNTSFKQR